MYYDPMIAKLITWGKDRHEAHELLKDAFDQYVIQGVTHNLGFGKSICENKDYAAGNYSTAFIPENYNEGYFGEKLETRDHEILAISSFVLREQQISKAGSHVSPNEMYVEFPAADKDSAKITFRVSAT